MQMYCRTCSKTSGKADTKIEEPFVVLHAYMEVDKEEDENSEYFDLGEAFSVAENAPTPTSRRGGYRCYSNEKIAKFIGLVISESFSRRKAAIEAGINPITAYDYYNRYLAGEKGQSRHKRDANHTSLRDSLKNGNDRSFACGHNAFCWLSFLESTEVPDQVKVKASFINEHIVLHEIHIRYSLPFKDTLSSQIQHPFRVSCCRLLLQFLKGKITLCFQMVVQCNLANLKTLKRSAEVIFDVLQDAPHQYLLEYPDQSEHSHIMSEVTSSILTNHRATILKHSEDFWQQRAYSLLLNNLLLHMPKPRLPRCIGSYPKLTLSQRVCKKQRLHSPFIDLPAEDWKRPDELAAAPARVQGKTAGPPRPKTGLFATSTKFPRYTANALVSKSMEDIRVKRTTGDECY
ncbi:hypothetical protein DFQ30_006369 [Apophysomyces sp. BC1015]|nr:hypothetical protein DFQ30_006369 [Apophysomyces sp. BC1015]